MVAARPWSIGSKFDVQYHNSLPFPMDNELPNKKYKVSQKTYGFDVTIIFNNIEGIQYLI